MKTFSFLTFAFLLLAPSANAGSFVLVCTENQSRYFSVDFRKTEEQFLFRGLEAAGIESGVGYSSAGGTTDDTNPDELIQDFLIVKGKLPEFGQAPKEGMYPTNVRIVNRAGQFRAEVFAGVFGMFGQPAFKAACVRK